MDTPIVFGQVFEFFSISSSFGTQLSQKRTMNEVGLLCTNAHYLASLFKMLFTRGIPFLVTLFRLLLMVYFSAMFTFDFSSIAQLIYRAAIGHLFCFSLPMKTIGSLEIVQLSLSSVFKFKLNQILNTKSNKNGTLKLQN